jgi:DNA-binding CsgD family transcriptional regulator
MAATSVDGDLADELETLARTQREHLSSPSASASFELAARLTPDAAIAADRLAAALDDAVVAGDVDRARTLAAPLTASEGPVRGRALAALGSLEQVSGSVVRSVTLLRSAVDHLEGRRRAWALWDLAMAYHRLGDYPSLASTVGRLIADADTDDPQQRLIMECAAAAGSVAIGATGDGESHAARALDLYSATPELLDEPRNVLLAIIAGGLLPITPARMAFIDARVSALRERGALAILVSALSMLSYAWALAIGDQAGAFANAGEAVELAEQLGLVADAAPALELLAWQYAARGADDDAAAALRRSEQLVERAGTTEVAAHLALTQAFCALCRDDHVAVVDGLRRRIEIDGGRGAMGEPLGVAPPLVESLVALGQVAEARELAERFAALPPVDARSGAIAERCTALTADDDDEAAVAYERALTAHALAGADKFEWARTELLFGARLRRSGRRADAREYLRRAHARFAEMELTRWADRAAHELAATGETARRRRVGNEEPLTAQETRVAQLVGRGMTNREVAAMLFVSPKTVEYHLSNVYRKRGVRSRTELARLMADQHDG